MTHRLGAPVTFTRTLTRRRQYVARQGPLQRWDYARPGFDRKWWESVSVDPWGKPGILVGFRTLQNGRSEHVYADEDSRWVVDNTFTAYLIAFDLRRKPVLCLPEHVKFLEGPPQLALEQP